MVNTKQEVNNGGLNICNQLRKGKQIEMNNSTWRKLLVP